MSIKPLPPEAVRQIKSSVVITSLNETIIGLVRNSLDARASRLNITVDYSRGNCIVEDDGMGIPPDEFLADGGLGRLHHTSRYPRSDDTFGVHGNFVASLAALSLLSITSHHAFHTTHNTITFHNGKCLARNTPALPEHQRQAFSHGTRATVRDLFGNMAVRVKQRPSAADKSVLDRDFNSLVHNLTAILLAWPANVNFLLRDSGGRNTVRLRPSTTDANAIDAPVRTSRILVQSELADDISYGTWVAVGASTSTLSVQGSISLNAVTTRRAQFISLGIHPMAIDQGFGALYDDANRVFANSDFANSDDPDSQSFPRKDQKSKRGLERWPMFSFRVENKTPLQHTGSFEDILDQPQKLLRISDLIKVICFEFLKKYHFRPHAVSSGCGLKRPASGADNTSGVQKRTKTASTSKGRSGTSTPVPRPESPFDLWERVKVGKARQPPPKASVNNARLPPFPLSCSTSAIKGAPSPVKSTAFVDKEGRLLRKPFDDIGLPASLLKQNTRGLEPRAEVTDSPEEDADTNGKTSNEDRGGVISSDTQSFPVQPETKSRLFSKSIRLEKAKPQEEPSEWLKSILRSWENPVFPAVEAPINWISEATTTAGIEARGGSNYCGSYSGEMSSLKMQGRLSKQSLLDAEVISQVDNKFILVKLQQNSVSQFFSQGSDDMMLVIVDQHAADERCKLEVVMREYFTRGGDAVIRAETTVLSVPITFELRARECELLRRRTQHFEHWGIFYVLSAPASSSRPVQSSTIEVLSLPPSILERCKAEPKLLVDLLRNEAWRLEEEGATTLPQSSRSRDAEDWVSNFQGCPPGIIDMLNSRSCRSAIMFNDILSLEDCKDLVRRLSGCLFPFQCAHGRPSMAPLVDMKSFSTALRGGFRKRESFGKRLKALGLEK